MVDKIIEAITVLLKFLNAAFFRKKDFSDAFMKKKLENVLNQNKKKCEGRSFFLQVIFCLARCFYLIKTHRSDLIQM